MNYMPMGYGAMPAYQAMPYYAPNPLPAVQYGYQQGPQVPYQSQGQASLDAIFGTRYSAQGYGTFEFSPNKLSMGPGSSNSPISTVQAVAMVALPASAFGGNSGGANFGGVDLFGAASCPASTTWPAWAVAAAMAWVVATEWVAEWAAAASAD